MKSQDKQFFYKLSPDQVGGETVYLEAGGEPEAGRVAVAWVIKNRADHPCSFQGRDIVSVCYFPAAFSCYLATDGQYVKAVSIAQAFDVFADPAARPLIDRWTRQDAQALRECWEIFKGVIAGEIPSPFETDDVFMYYAAGTKKPFWADKLVFAKQIGGHLFYRGR